MLHELPLEVQEKIYNLLQIVDLQNLSCCSYKLDDTLKEYLWTCVKIRKSNLLDHCFGDNIRLKNVRHAQILRIVAHSHENEQRKVIRRNFNRILKYCNPKVLYAFLTISDVLEGILNMCSLTAFLSLSAQGHWVCFHFCVIIFSVLKICVQSEGACCFSCLFDCRF